MKMRKRKMDSIPQLGDLHSNNCYSTCKLFKQFTAIWTPQM
jgi:hypothetical protein